MFDTDLLFSNAATITQDGFGTAVQVDKTPADGVWIEIAVTALSGSTPLLDCTVYEHTNTTQTTANQVLATFPQISATGRYFRLVQTKKSHLHLHYNVTGTSFSATVTAGIVSGPTPDAGA